VPKNTVSTVRVLLGLSLLLLLADGSMAGQWGSNYFPNYELTNQDGQTLHFYDDVIKGKVVAINFMYTSCEDVCPVETAKLREVQRRLGDRVGHDVFLYSISIDPEHDTPEVLKAYAKQFHAGPGWQFLTGKESEIKELQKRLGLYIQSIQDIDPLDHNVSLVLGNETTGRWLKRTPFESTDILTNLLGYGLHGNRRQPGTLDYASAEKLTDFDRGEYLFKTRCASCHTMGGGNEIGPDLINVAVVRDRAWLKRWIKEPDVMLAEGDPLGTQLVKQYGGLPMPNLALNDVDLEALVEFLESRGSGQLQSAQ
jgi:protein SCO1/2